MRLRTAGLAHLVAATIVLAQWAPASAAFRAAATLSAAAPAAPRVTATVLAHLRPLPAASVPPTLSAIAYAGGGVVVAVGSRCAGLPEVCRGVVLRTTDGGARWRLAAGPPGPLTHVAALGATFLWAWGPDDAFASDDGGARWRALALPAGPHTRPAIVFVSFASPEDGWLATGGLAGGGCAATGCATALYGTADGGRRWAPLSSTGLLGLGVTGAPASLPWGEYMAGGDDGNGRGWLLVDGARGAVVVTRDGGRHWSTAVTLNTGGAPVQAAGGGGPGRVWSATLSCGPTACGDASTLFFSADGGLAWTAAGRVEPQIAALAPAAAGSAVWALTAVRRPGACLSSTVCAGGVAVVSAAARTRLFHAIPAGGLTLQAVAARNAQEAWALAVGAGAGQVIVHTSDGGARWRVQDRVADTAVPGGVWGFWNAGSGWAVGTAADPAAVLRTVDGGRVWRQVGEVPVSSPQSAGFASPAFGWAVDGGDGRLLVTRDGGAAWHAAAARPLGCGVDSAGFASPSWGWATSLAAGGCAGGELFVTADGGARWRQVPLPGQVVSAAFAGPGVGWAVVTPEFGGGAPVLLESTRDAGATWTPVAVLGSFMQPNALWNGSLRVDPAGGVWIGDLRSGDGGRTWTRFSLPPSAFDSAAGGSEPSPQTLVGGFANVRVGWLQAAGGLYRTEDGGRTWRQVAAMGG